MRLVLLGLFIWVFVLGAEAVAAEGAPSMLDAAPLKIFYDITPAQREVCNSIFNSVSWRADGARQYFSIEAYPTELKEIFSRQGTAGESMFVYDVDVFGDGSYTSIFLFEVLTSKFFYQDFYAINNKVKDFISEEMKLTADIYPSLQKNFIKLTVDIKESTGFSEHFVKFEPYSGNSAPYDASIVRLFEIFGRLIVVKLNDREIGNPIISVNFIEKDGALRPLCAFDSKYGDQFMSLSGGSTEFPCPHHEIKDGYVDFSRLRNAQGAEKNIRISSDSNWEIYEIKNSELLILRRENWGLIQSQSLYSIVSKNLLSYFEKQASPELPEESNRITIFDFETNATEASEVRESDDRTYLIFHDTGPRLTGHQPEEGVTVYTANGEAIDYVCHFSFAVAPPPGLTVRP